MPANSHVILHSHWMISTKIQCRSSTEIYSPTPFTVLHTYQKELSSHIIFIQQLSYFGSIHSIMSIVFYKGGLNCLLNCRTALKLPIRYFTIAIKNIHLTFPFQFSKDKVSSMTKNYQRHSSRKQTSHDNTMFFPLLPTLEVMEQKNTQIERYSNSQDLLDLSASTSPKGVNYQAPPPYLKRKSAPFIHNASRYLALLGTF